MCVAPIGSAASNVAVSVAGVPIVTTEPPEPLTTAHDVSDGKVYTEEAETVATTVVRVEVKRNVNVTSALVAVTVALKMLFAENVEPRLVVAVVVRVNRPAELEPDAKLGRLTPFVLPNVNSVDRALSAISAYASRGSIAMPFGSGVYSTR